MKNFKYIKNFPAKYLIYVCLLLLIISPGVFAGEYAADFLRIGVGARALAMGGAFTALADDATSFYWNPAGLASVKKMVIHVDHVPMFDGLAQFNTANFSMGLNRNMTVGLSWIRHGEDDIPRYAELQGTRLERLTNPKFRSTGEPEGFFGNNENAFMFTLSRADYFDLYFNIGMNQYRIPLEFYFGFSGKYILHNLDAHSGTGQGLDGGFILRLVSDKYSNGQANSWFGIGVTAHDLSRTSITWDTESKHNDLVQTIWQTGVAASHFLPFLRTRVTLTFDQEFGFYDDYRIGGEMMFFHLLSVRGGYYMENFSVGAGFAFKGYSIDYAFISHDLANTHRISGSFRF